VQGLSCKRFQALPPSRSCAEADAALLALAAAQRWRACPACGVTVERSEGCNHMRCAARRAGAAEGGLIVCRQGGRAGRGM
jgi:hypothetical protein